MMTGRSRNRSKRSVVWGYFNTIDSVSVQCLLCGDRLIRRTIQGRGPTTNMLRHLRGKHPTEVFKTATLTNGTAINGHEDMETDGDFCSVDMVLDGGDSDMTSTVNNVEINSSIDSILRAAQEGPAEQILNEEADPGLPVKTRCRKRSLIWRHFEHLENLSVARCRICLKHIQCFEGGSTSNLHRHVSTKHPELFFQQVADGQHPPSQGFNYKVQVDLEDEDSETLSTVNDSVIISSDNGIPEATQGGSAEQIMQEEEEESDERPLKRPSTKHSLIWRHFVHVKSLGATRCNICMKKLHYDGSTTSNMHRHMSKRHPEVFSQLVAGRKHPPQPHSSQASNMNGDTPTPAQIAGETEKQRQISGALNLPRASEGEKRVLRRELELIEALRSAQREEARALEQQRELLEKLRAVNAREAAAEREQIESLRKAQREEAEDLNRQKEEVRREKAELQKKWDELQREREELVLFPEDTKTPDSVTA